MELRAHEHGAPAVGDEVRAGNLHAALVRQFHLDVAVAAGESGGGPDPIIAYPEPAAIESVGESGTLWAAAGTATESKTRTTTNWICISR